MKIVEGDNMSRPSWSPDGSELVVAVDTKQGSSIHIVKPDGTGDRVIGATIQDKDYFSASFSPDGTHLVFDKGTDSGFGIFVMNVDGSGLRRISAGTSDYNPSWSPDGTRIVFTRQEKGAESDIYVMDPDGSNVDRLTNDGPGVTNLDAEFSPDGARIAYIAGVAGGRIGRTRSGRTAAVPSISAQRPRPRRSPGSRCLAARPRRPPCRTWDSGSPCATSRA